MDFLVVSLPVGPGLPTSSAELVAGAMPLARRSGGSVAVAVLGRNVAEACRQAVAFGADRVYRIDADDLADYEADLYLQALEPLVRDCEPDAVLFAADPFTAELAPRLAHRLGTAAATGCTSFSLLEGRTADGGPQTGDGGTGRLLFVRPVYGGKAVAETVLTRVPTIATVAPHSFEPLPRADSREAEVVEREFRAEPASRRTRVLRVEREDEGGTRLEDARVIVSGGRGLGDATGFQRLEELAAVLGASVGASRPPVDLGWAPPAKQVGQTGKTVVPDLYVAVGISGASQHLAGMGGAKHVVVINTDPEAPFFRHAEVGVVADYGRLLPLLVQKLKAMMR